jgi:hypothetical protein
MRFLRRIGLAGDPFSQKKAIGDLIHREFKHGSLSIILMSEEALLTYHDAVGPFAQNLPAQAAAKLAGLNPPAGVAQQYLDF